MSNGFHRCSSLQVCTRPTATIRIDRNAENIVLGNENTVNI